MDEDGNRFDFEAICECGIEHDEEEDAFHAFVNHAARGFHSPRGARVTKDYDAGGVERHAEHLGSRPRSGPASPYADLVRRLKMYAETWKIDGLAVQAPISVLIYDAAAAIVEQQERIADRQSVIEESWQAFKAAETRADRAEAALAENGLAFQKSQNETLLALRSAEAALAECRELLYEVAVAGVSVENRKYSEIQIDNGTLAAIRATASKQKE